MKRQRHEQIIDLIKSFEIETQDDLALRLRDEGYNVTQATVSRDIRELKLFKVAAGGGRQKYALLPTGDEAIDPVAERVGEVFRAGILSVNYSGNIVVVKTVTGMAPAVGACVDSLALPELLGSVAGDDTVLCVVADGCEANEISARLDHYRE